MKLIEYIKETKVDKETLAKCIGVGRSTFYTYINETKTPQLLYAIRIVEFTKGKVGLKDLLVEEYTGPRTPYEVKKVYNKVGHEKKRKSKKRLGEDDIEDIDDLL